MGRERKRKGKRERERKTVRSAINMSFAKVGRAAHEQSQVNVRIWHARHPVLLQCGLKAWLDAKCAQAGQAGPTHFPRWVWRHLCPKGQVVFNFTPKGGGRLRLWLY
jgi:hypothetical protein